MSKSIPSAGQPGADRGRDQATGPTAAPLGAFDVRCALRTLFERAGDSLTASELQWISDGCRGTANAMAADAATMSEGLSCLVADDDPTTGVGSFQSPGDVAAVLTHFGRVFETVSGLLELSMAADNAKALRGFAQ